MFGLFLSQDTTKRWWANYSHRFIPNTCMSIKERVTINLPSSWEINCPGTENLIIEIQSKAGNKSTAKETRATLYKELANAYATFAVVNNLETLEMLRHLTITLDHPQLKIISKTDGKSASRFPSLKHKNDIALHLRASVKVREIPK